MWKRTNKSMVGVDIGSSSVKTVELQGKNGDFQLMSLGYEGLPADSVVDGQIMELNAVSSAIGNIFNEHKIKTTRVAAGVNGHSVIVKNIVLPQMSEEELQESFAWHAEEHIPFDISDVNLDYHVTDSTPDAIHVLLAACKRDKVANLKQAIQLAGNQYTSLLQKELGLTFDQAEQVKRGLPLPDSVEPRDIEPILDTVSDILAL